MMFSDKLVLKAIKKVMKVDKILMLELTIYNSLIKLKFKTVYENSIKLAH